MDTTIDWRLFRVKWRRRLIRYFLVLGRALLAPAIDSGALFQVLSVPVFLFFVFLALGPNAAAEEFMISVAALNRLSLLCSMVPCVIGIQSY